MTCCSPEPTGERPGSNTSAKGDLAREPDEGSIDDWCRVVVAGYPVHELDPYEPGALFDARTLGDPAWTMHVGYAGGEPVTASALYVSDGLALLALGVTTEAARGKGYWYGMVRTRLARAGDRIAAALFSDMSQPGAEKLGFIPIVRFTVWERLR